MGQNNAKITRQKKHTQHNYTEAIELRWSFPDINMRDYFQASATETEKIS